MIRISSMIAVSLLVGRGIEARGHELGVSSTSATTAKSSMRLTTKTSRNTQVVCPGVLFLICIQAQLLHFFFVMALLMAIFDTALCRLFVFY